MKSRTNVSFWKTYTHLYLIYYAGGCNANKGVWGFISYLPYKYFSMKKYASSYFFRTVVCSVTITANKFVKIIFFWSFYQFSLEYQIKQNSNVQLVLFLYFYKSRSINSHSLDVYELEQKIYSDFTHHPKLHTLVFCSLILNRKYFFHKILFFSL